MKKIILIIIALVFLGTGIYFSYYTFNKPVVTREIKDSPFAILFPDSKSIFSENKDWYEITVEYPKNSQIIRDTILKQANDFKKEYELDKFQNFSEASSTLGIMSPEAKYAFSATYELVNASNTVTYIYTIYTYTGGAHGSTLVYPITLDTNFRILTAEEILPTEKLEKVAGLARTQIEKQRRENLKSVDLTDKEIDDMLKTDTWMQEGTAPKRDNYNAVWLEDENIITNFGQYQVASYAEGMFTVIIPRKTIFD